MYFRSYKYTLIKIDTGCPGFGTIPPLCIASEQSVNIFCLSSGPYTDLAAFNEKFIIDMAT